MMKKHQVYTALFFIVVVLVLFAILLSPKLYFQKQLRDLGISTPAKVLDTQKKLALCSVRYYYEVPLVNGRVKSYTEQSNIPCSSIGVYESGSEITIQFLPPNPAKSNIEGNTIVWWVDLVRALAILIGIISIGVVGYILSPGQRLSLVKVVILTLALGVAGASVMLALMGFEYMNAVLLMGIAWGLLMPFALISRWYSQKISSILQGVLNSNK